MGAAYSKPPSKSHCLVFVAHFCMFVRFVFVCVISITWKCEFTSFFGARVLDFHFCVHKRFGKYAKKAIFSPLLMFCNIKTLCIVSPLQLSCKLLYWTPSMGTSKYRQLDVRYGHSPRQHNAQGVQHHFITPRTTSTRKLYCLLKILWKCAKKEISTSVWGVQQTNANRVE